MDCNQQLQETNDSLSLNHKNEFRLICERLNNLIKEIKEYNPKAQYYFTNYHNLDGAHLGIDMGNTTETHFIENLYKGYIV
jgi:hypothetical protein